MHTALRKPLIAAAAAVLMAGSAAMLPGVAYAQHHHHGHGWDWGGFAAGAAAGAILGGALSSQAQAPYYEDRYYYDDAVQWCMRKYKSYDPYSRTWLGRDGYRHPCP